MRTGSMLIHQQRPLTRRLASGGIAIALLAGCGASGRPAISEWTETWNEAQELVPTEQEFAEGGRAYCDQLLGQLRIELPALTPAPSESIDPALDAWSDQLQTLAFECPSNPSIVRQELSKLHNFESEIAAVLP